MPTALCFCLLFVLHCNATNFSDIPLDAQRRSWSYLERRERRKMRELSVACDEKYQKVYPGECTKMRAFYNFSVFISAMDPAQPCLIASFRRKMSKLKLKDHFDGSNGDIILIEKLVYTIASNKYLYESSKDDDEIRPELNACLVRTLVVGLLDYLNIFHERHAGLQLMFRTVLAFGSSNYMNKIFLLNDLFVFGFKTTKQIGNKSNRFCKFGLLHLDLFLDSNAHNPQARPNDRGLNFHPSRLRTLWNTIVNVELIEEYLKHRELRGEDADIGIVLTPIRLIIDDAFGPNRTFKTDKLHLFVEHPKLFFNLGNILEFSMKTEHAHQVGVMDLLEFLVDNDLMTWQTLDSGYLCYRWFQLKYGGFGSAIGFTVRGRSQAELEGLTVDHYIINHNPLSKRKPRHCSNSTRKDEQGSAPNCCCDVM